MKDLFGKCGVNCGRCPGFAGNARTGEDRQWCSDGWAKYIGARLKPESIHCLGCQAPEPWKSGSILPDRNCIIRPCAVKTGVETCAQCSAYPCGAHSPDMDREKIAARLGTPIPEKDYLAFIEPYEGCKHLDQIRASLSPEEIMPVAEVKPIRAKITAFPDDLPCSEEEISAFRAVHGLLVKVLTAPADVYARQLTLKRRRPHMLGLLWVLGLYGELKEEDGSQLLVLDGTTYGSRKECGWLVRKRDNSFHGVTQQAARFLEDLKVHCEFVPLKRGWLLKLSFGEEAGGKAALDALKRYAVGLGEKYGEPLYAGNTRFKGEAFARFSKVDM